MKEGYRHEQEKAHLASAILSVAALAASCGGGGGGTTAQQPPAGGGGGGGGGGTQVTTEAELIASVTVGASGVAGVNNKYAKLTLKSNGDIEVQLLSDTGVPNVPLYKIHTFANGNHLLQDDQNRLYLLKTDGTIEQLKDGANPLNAGGTGLTRMDAVRAKYVALDLQNNNQAADAILTQTGKFYEIVDGTVTWFAEDFIVADCPTATTGLTANAGCVIKADGTVIALASNATIASAAASGQLVRLTNNTIYLITTEGQATRLHASALALSAPGRTFPVVRSGSDTYVAYTDGNIVQYHKVSGGSLASGWSAGALVGVTNNASYALDASGRLFVIDSNLVNDDEYRVYTSPISFITGSAGANAFSAGADILFVGDGIAYVSSADSQHTVVAKIFASGGGVTSFSATISGFDGNNSTALSAANVIIRRSGNELLVIANNYDSVGSDAFYLKLDSTNTWGVGGTFAEQNLYSAPNIRTLLGSPLVVTDYNFSNNTTLYKCSISSTPCTALSNVKLTDLDINATAAGARIVYAQGREITDMFFGSQNPNFTLNNPVVLALNAEVGSACASGTFTPILLNLDKDTKQSFSPVEFNCVQRQAFGNVQVKADGSVGKRVYGQTPAGSPRCLNTNGFDNIVLVRENGTTVTFRLAEKTGYCFLSAIDVK